MPTDELIEVRVARPDQYDAIGELCVAAYQQSGQLRVDDPYESVLRDAAARARDAELLVAMRGGSIVGTVTICSAPSPFGEISEVGESEFRFLAVAPSARGTGVGKALVTACDERARDLGHERVVICVKSDNDTARRMYLRLGFTALPERDWKPRPDVDLRAYTRPVPYP